MDIPEPEDPTKIPDEEILKMSGSDGDRRRWTRRDSVTQAGVATPDRRTTAIEGTIFTPKPRKPSADDAGDGDNSEFTFGFAGADGFAGGDGFAEGDKAEAPAADEVTKAEEEDNGEEVTGFGSFEQ